MLGSRTLWRSEVGEWSFAAVSCHGALFLRICFLLVMSCLLSGCGEEINRATADQIAKRTLERYSMREGLITGRFLPGEVIDEGECWLYEYTYPDPPRQLVAISVYKNGKAELGRMLDDNVLEPR